MTEWRTSRPLLTNSGMTVVADIVLPGGTKPTIVGKLSLKNVTDVDELFNLAWEIRGESGSVYDFLNVKRWKFKEMPDSQPHHVWKDAVELQWEQYCDLWDQLALPGTRTQLSFWREMSEAGRASRISKLKEQLSVEDSFSTKYASTHGEIW